DGARRAARTSPARRAARRRSAGRRRRRAARVARRHAGRADERRVRAGSRRRRRPAAARRRAHGARRLARSRAAQGDARPRGHLPAARATGESIVSVFAVARKELTLYFTSLLFYALTAVFLVLSGWLFYTNLDYFIRFGGMNLVLGLWQYQLYDMRQ